MKNTAMLLKIFIGLMLVVVTACSTNDEGDDPIVNPITPIPVVSDLFWYGYYSENPLTNPEDPTPGFVYLQIPETGAFEGEMYFSFEGCDDTFDVGSVNGTVSENNLSGNWQGNVDGVTVGGDYVGTLNSNGTEYSGTFTNAAGKVEIECNSSDSIFVAPDGTWFLGKGDENELDITLDVDVDPITATWSNVNGVFIYLYVIVDTECLEEGKTLEECLMWSGRTLDNNFEYGDDTTVPAKPLQEGKTYLVSVAGIKRLKKNDLNKVLK